MTEQDLWEAALVKCGYWKPQQRCRPERAIDSVYMYQCDHNQITNHYIDAPALGDAAAVVAMLEWGKQHEMGVSYDKLIGEWMATCAKNGEHLGEMSSSWIECYHKSLPLALAAAVNEVQP